jgi:hypothetical protein
MAFSEHACGLRLQLHQFAQCKSGPALGSSFKGVADQDESDDQNARFVINIRRDTVGEEEARRHSAGCGIKKRGSRTQRNQSIHIRRLVQQR